MLNVFRELREQNWVYFCQLLFAIEHKQSVAEGIEAVSSDNLEAAKPLDETMFTERLETKKN